MDPLPALRRYYIVRFPRDFLEEERIATSWYDLVDKSTKSLGLLNFDGDVMMKEESYISDTLLENVSTLRRLMYLGSI